MATNESAPKRFKWEVLSSNASSGLRADSALELSSEDVPDGLKCPVCQKLPLGEVYQCPNGHRICKQCQEGQNKLRCDRCNESLKDRQGQFIRSLIVEQVVDRMLIKCPYQTNGCQEVLSREHVLNHKNHCRYSGGQVQMCRLFRGEGCAYWSQVNDPEGTIQHLRAHFEFPTKSQSYLRLQLEEPFEESYTGALVSRENGVFLTVLRINPETDRVSFACLQMDKATLQPKEVKTLELTFQGRARQWKLTLPAESVVNASLVLEQMPVSLSRSFLKQLCGKGEADAGVGANAGRNGMLKIIINIY